MELSRRGFIQAAAAPAILRKAPRYNLLFLMSDQHQRNAVGCYGNAQVQTPHIDALARDSVRFTGTYCPSPVCVPSRGSLITGLYAHKHGARILDDALPADVPTVGHYFGERGYSTAAIGKMHFVDESRRHGFAHRLNEESFRSQRPPDARQRMRALAGDIGGVDGAGLDLGPEYFEDNWFADRAVDFLRAHREKPFCLWTSFLQPHTPFRPMKRYFDLYDPANLTLPRRPANDLEGGFEGHLIRAKERGWYQQSDEAARVSMAGYYGNISQMDDNLGRVWNELRELGLAKNTVVVYTSDHGEMASAHRMYTKHNMFEESVAVPLSISVPDGERGVRHEFIEQVDLFPTLAELCGLDAVSGLHGRSFARALNGGEASKRDFVYSEYWFCRNVFTRDDRYVGKPPLLMVRTSRYKLNYLSWGRSELFDLENDPGEFENRIDHPGLQDIRTELTRIAQRQYQLE
ncbi:MAG: sulfatase-like hydrolase/transferase [Bryobacterales bacterium]|nr:sulfatase-like hydrolase/transferase [Bryobacterales bacterium]